MSQKLILLNYKSYNLDKYYSNKNKEDTYSNLNLGEYGQMRTLSSQLFSNVVNHVDNIHFSNIEIPISLNRSEFPLFLIKDNF